MEVSEASSREVMQTSQVLESAGSVVGNLPRIVNQLQRASVALKLCTFSCVVFTNMKVLL